MRRNVSTAVLCISLLTLFIYVGCKPTNQSSNSSSNTENPASQPTASSGGTASTPSTDESNDKKAIQDLINNASADLAKAVNDRDYNKLDKYFDMSDPTVRTHLEQVKRRLKTDTDSKQDQVHDMTLTNVQVKNLAIHGDHADAIVSATLNGKLTEDRQTTPIVRQEAEKIRFRKTSQGWKIIDASYEER
ncbi:MAG TPA: hypothetical protein VFC63_05890 [Blastocatellia bacterium]|nr:hypothetical protein [Blastocatellia bacterium]